MTKVAVNRKQLYEEVWTDSAAKVSRKYGIPYGQFLAKLREVEIPIPPSGYWTKINFGKPVSKAPLPPFPENEVVVFESSPQRKTVSSIPAVLAAQEGIGEKTPQEIESQQETEGFASGGKNYNLYDRATLYQEVWECPVTEVAKKYGVSDVAIHKVCKSLNVPTPPLGYWAKLRAGKPVKKKPLPEYQGPVQKTGGRPNPVHYAPKPEPAQRLAFLEEEDRAVILAVAAQIQLSGENARMHPKLIAHRKKLAEWGKQERQKDRQNVGRYRSKTDVPYLYDSIATESIPRVCRMLDTMIRALEPLGASMTDSLAFVIRGETIPITFQESQDQIPHVVTREENMSLLVYRDAQKRGTYASKPNIRKYDHVYNGKLSLNVYRAHGFRDCTSYRLEDRLGDVIIDLYEASEVLIQERLAREEAERRRKEEERLREERRERYNKEVARTAALRREAEDYDIACKIRAYIAAIEAGASTDEDVIQWLSWAKQKADWYDPTIKEEDPFFGVREHSKSSERKEPQEKSYYRW